MSLMFVPLQLGQHAVLTLPVTTAGTRSRLPKADSRKADAPMAVSCHLIFGSYFCTFAQAAGGLHISTYVVTRSRPCPR